MFRNAVLDRHRLQKIKIPFLTIEFGVLKTIFTVLTMSCGWAENMVCKQFKTVQLVCIALLSARNLPAACAGRASIPSLFRQPLVALAQRRSAFGSRRLPIDRPGGPNYEGPRCLFKVRGSDHRTSRHRRKQRRQHLTRRTATATTTNEICLRNIL